MNTKLTDRLRALPAVEIRPDGWPDVQQRIAARQAAGARLSFGLRLAAAASVTLIAVIAAWRVSNVATEHPGTMAVQPPPLTAEQALALDRVAQLQTQSQTLDDMLIELGAHPFVERAGTSLPIDTLEAQVQWLDHQISASDGELEPDSAERLWRSRVEAMDSLVRLRYVEAQRVDM